MANQPLHLANNAQKKNRFCFPATPFSQQKNVTCHVLLLTFNRRVYSLVSWSLKKKAVLRQQQSAEQFLISFVSIFPRFPLQFPSSARLFQYFISSTPQLEWNINAKILSIVRRV